MEDLSDYRKSYEKSELSDVGLPDDPIALFRAWFFDADTSDQIHEANAMTVATLGLDGFPKSRVVLLKQYDDNGFVFYTNYESEKGKAIAANPHVCLSFFWPPLERQVIIKGSVEKTSDAVSDEYFDSRPYGSKIGAIVSNQSEVISSRAFIEQKLESVANTVQGTDISRPSHWGGYLVRPVEIEFWQGRPNRLHDRIRYVSQNGESWKHDRLSP